MSEDDLTPELVVRKKRKLRPRSARQRNRGPPKFGPQDIGDFIGHGAYAAAFKSENHRDVVYRLEFFRPENRNEVYREAAIQEFLWEKKVGPSIGRVYLHDEFETSKFEAGIMRQIPGNKQAIEDEFFAGEEVNISLTALESGDEGNLKKKEIKEREEDFSTMAFLLWTFLSANSQFGFRHRDIKRANVVMQKVPSDTTYTFHFGKERTLTKIQPKSIPLLIDFGFSSLLTTRSIRRHMHGTYSTMPPEALCADLLREAQKLETCTNAPAESAYDLWSLGVLLIEVVTGEKRPLFFPHKTTRMYEWIKRHIHNHILRMYRPVRPNLEDNLVRIGFKVYVMVCIYLFQLALRGQFGPPANLMYRVYSPYILDESFDELVKFIKKNTDFYSHYVEVVQKIDNTTLDEQEEEHPPRLPRSRRIFAMLLDWDPRRRIGHNERLYEAVLYLMKKCRRAEKQGANVKEFTLKKRPLFDMSDDYEYKDQQYESLSTVRYIAGEACETCGDKSGQKFVCTQCARVVCGEECHVK